MGSIGQELVAGKVFPKECVNAVVSIIIVNYNCGVLLRDCVDSLLPSESVAQVIIIDNASSDGSVDCLVGRSDLQVIKNPSNLGFAAACNVGMRVASAPFLFFLNPDCLIEPGALAILLQVIQGNKDVGMVGGLVVNPDGTEQAGGRRAIPTPWRSFVRAFGLAHFSRRWPRLFFDFYLHKQPLPKTPIEVEAISGACMLVRREAMDQVGYWDEGYFLHCEDLDLCMSIRRHGWKVMFVPSAKVVHALGVSSRSRPVFVEWHKHKGMIRFYRKFFRHQYPGLLMVLVILGVWLRFAGFAAYHVAKRAVGRD